MSSTHPYLADAPFACLAHRGGALEAPENTMAAFAAARALGYRYVETDVQVTADGAVAVFHDDGLERLTDGSGLLSELPWSAVEQARIGGTEPIMSLAEALETFPDVRFNIDIKTDAGVEPTVELIRAMGCFERVCLAAFSDRRLRRLRDLAAGRACIGAGPRDVTALKFASWGAPKRALQVHCAQVPLRAYGITLVTPRFIRQCHAQNIVVHVWTIDDAREMRRLIHLGVDGIMSDRPSLLKQVAQEEGVWCEF